MLKAKYLKPHTINVMRNCFRRAAIATDQNMIDFFETIVLKPVIIAFMIGICAGLLLAIGSAS